MNFELIQISDITNNLDSKRIPLNANERKEKQSNPIYPYVGANNILDYIDEYIFDEKILCVAEDGGNWGYNEQCAVIINEKCWVNNHAHVLTAKSNLHLEYLCYYLNYADLSLHITGATRGKLNQGTLNKIKIPLPPLKTQEHIAGILDNAAALRDKTAQLLEEYDLLAQSIFLEMFADPVLNPKGWDILRLVKITNKIGSGATPRGGKNSYKEEGISLIRSLNIHDNEFKLKDLAFVDEVQAERLQNVTLERNDVLINITGASVTRCTIVPDNILPARVNQHVSILRCKPEKINPVFLLHLIISPNTKVKLLGVGSSSGATRESITKKQLEEFEVILPSIKLQNEFAEKIALIEQQKDLARQELKESEDLFNCLLQKAFKGELVREAQEI